MSVLQYWTVDPPKPWQAGTTGANREPFYFSCADCHEKDAKIAGIISTDGTYSGIGLIGTLDGCNLRPAMFCASCYANRPRPRNPGGRTGHHPPGRTHTKEPTP
jgi:hypothetical protein